MAKLRLAGKTYNPGKKLGAGELEKYARKSKYTTESILRRAEDAGIKISSGAKNYSPGSSQTNNTNNDNTYREGGDNTGNTNAPYDFGALFQDVIAPFQTDLANIQAGATTRAATIRGEADKEVARAYADAQRYGSELGLEGTKYASDKESEWRQAVANIEVGGRLDLQPIINAGLEKVAGIEAQAQRDVAETSGKYSLASTKEQTAAQERIGKMNLAGSMYGLLSSAFG
jgi:hypothetical protein